MHMSADARARSNELTLLAFASTVVMLFAAFTAAYLIRRTGADWHRVSLPSILWYNTIVLLASSVTIEIARRTGARPWLVVTTILGFAFLIGQGMAWRALAAKGLYLPTSPHSAFLYVLTAVHGVHLMGGLVVLVVATFRNRAVRLCAIYWHFVDAVWLYLVIMLTQL